ncbi:MgtC/SapB family protein [Thalassolituus sp. LLYu03]|uniref:MgtC/SapB family protein n=1 Tax=Thalassolituus sp. LLYu03 TaxID=3421656 RepID=UPI003D2D649D
MSWEELIDVAPLDWTHIISALAIGTIIGLERQLRGKPVGIRTSSLIVLGTYVFVELSSYISNAGTDNSRIIGQVVTGVGFLGAGVMLAKDGIVLGVTSAATIWALAAIGVALSVGTPGLAIKLALLVVIILVGVDVLENYSSAFTRGVHSRYSSWRSKR